MAVIAVETMTGIAELIRARRDALASSSIKITVDLLPRGFLFEMLGPRTKHGRRRGTWAISFAMLADVAEPVETVRRGLDELETHWRSVDK